MVKMIRNSMIAVSLLAASGAQAVERNQTPDLVRAEALPAGTQVRLTSGWIESGTWFKGTVGEAGGCAVVKLQQPAAGGYDQVTLLAISRLQRADAGQWTDVPVASLLAAEPAECRIGSTD